MTPRIALPSMTLSNPFNAWLTMGRKLLGHRGLLIWSFLQTLLTPVLLNLGVGMAAFGSLVLAEALLVIAMRMERGPTPAGILAIEVNTLGASAYLAAGSVYALVGRLDLAAALAIVGAGKLLLSVRAEEPSARLCASIACLVPSVYLSMRLFFATAFPHDPAFAATEVVTVAIIVDVLLVGSAIVLERGLIREGMLHPAFGWAPLLISGVLFSLIALMAVFRASPEVKIWLIVKAAIVLGAGIRFFLRPEEHVSGPIG
ncbi:hypothetical protein [Marinivivus vitaminiproducens]|uniref:hypothetical protein n=1 Tax=Marinivivus vitaminiproducens TaxID=3035935 RepID=UPI00279B198A|nr:hypothetical protein P4R82_13570 [Geminicoccaceae bacterium SCSIO 64248]